MIKIIATSGGNTYSSVKVSHTVFSAIILVAALIIWFSGKAEAADLAN